MTSTHQTVRIGGASGYWGDAALATPQLLAAGRLDFIVYDYLAEITMAILARMHAKDATLGYATDFVTGAMAPNLSEIAQQGVKVVSNAGGINPAACADALRTEIATQGLSLKVAVVTGDNLMADLQNIAANKPTDMFTAAPFPQVDKISSINAYLGAFPVAAVLATGADIVITGRCVDSAVTLGACIHAFGWGADELDLLAAGSLAGHIIECGPQATGGNFTDWEEIAATDATIGYPIVEVARDGGFVVSKPDGSGGKVSIGTVSEQLVYEIGDPQAYVLPDVTCDFSSVTLTQPAPDEVQVRGAIGLSAPKNYKTCLTWHDGYRGGHLFGFYGLDAERKASYFANSALERARSALKQMNAPDFSETSVEILGAESQFGEARQSPGAREVNVKIAVKHVDVRGVALFLKEATGLGLSAPPGLSGFAGARPKPSPVMALFSFLVPKSDVKISIVDDGGERDFNLCKPQPVASIAIAHPTPICPPVIPPIVDVPLVRLAWARSGDKGDNANIGVIARRAEFLPYIWHAFDDETIRHLFGHFLKGGVHRYILPGLNAMNIVLTGVLGGGGTSSLRNDPQGKGYAQLVLAHTLAIPEYLLEDE